jgi:hypothetical protein
MTTRRKSPAREEPIQRLARRAEEDRQATADGFAAVLEGIEDLRTEVRRGAQNTGLLGQRLDQLEFQVNLTRDEVQRRAVNPAPSQIESAKRAIKDTAKSPLGIVASIMAIICSGYIIIGNIPDTQRAFERVWVFFREFDQTHAEPKIDGKAGT